MGVFGPNSTPSIQPTVRHIEKPNPDSQRRQKQDQPGKEEKKPAERAKDVIEFEHGPQGSATAKAHEEKKPEPRHIDFSA